MRTVTDEQGRIWRVWHVMPQSAVLIQTSPEMGKGWLCFESERGKWRLTQPPADWATMPDEDVLKLMDGAREVRKAGMSGV